MRLLGTNCISADSNNANEIIFVLKAIGNMGKQKAIPLIMDCVRQAPHVNISVAAIQALRRMTLDGTIKNTLLEVFTERNHDLEKRMEAFLMLMKNPTENDIILARDVANDIEESVQLRSFLVSYLESAGRNRNPQDSRSVDIFRILL